MPKVSSTPASSARPALRRNQACRSCRKRKLKCDAARPHCGTCVKQWQALTSVPAPVGYAHPSEPQCSYDPVEGLTQTSEVDPVEKIRQLEEQISQLKKRLDIRNDSQMGSPNHRSPYLGDPSSSRVCSSPDQAASSSRTGLVHSQLSTQGNMNFLSPETPNRTFGSEMGSPGLTAINRKSSGDSFMELLFSGWNTDLPDPAVLHHYVEVFFRCDPCGSRVLHQPSFLASLLLSPKDPGFPHSAILHAICASASRWSPQNITILPDGTRRDQFAEYHAGKTRQYIDKTMASGQDIFQVMQACILLAWYFYQEGRWVEVWIFAGFQTRVAIPLRLNYPGTFSTHATASPGAYLAPPKNFRDLESRRRTWWMTMVFDRISSVGGWIHAVDERDIGTEFPLRNDDFNLENSLPNNPQDLATPDVFTRHLPHYTDSFLLLIKATMMFGKVTDFNVRGNLRAPMAPSKSQNPFLLPGFTELDQLVSQDFLDSLPPIYKNAIQVGSGLESNTFDTDLYMVHVIPHAATITLHNPYIDFSNRDSTSTKRCIHAAQKILEAYYPLSSTSLDITRLHPFVVICWYLAAVVQIQLCKYFIEIGDTEREQTVWGEINILRFAMLEYGFRSPIGTRQERLLQGLMGEIVRMTSQKEPLEVGVPLYPFSHATLFRKDDSDKEAEKNNQAATAPLPSFEEDQGLTSPSASGLRRSSTGSSHTPPTFGAAATSSPNMGSPMSRYM